MFQHFNAYKGTIFNECVPFDKLSVHALGGPHARCVFDMVGMASATCKLPVLHKEGPNPYTRVKEGMVFLASIIIVVTRIHF